MNPSPLALGNFPFPPLKNFQPSASSSLLHRSSCQRAGSWASSHGASCILPHAIFLLPRCCLHQHSPSHGNQQPWCPPSQASLPSSAALPWMKPGAPSSFSTAVGTPTPPSAPHPSHGGRRAPCSSFGERLQQGAFFPSGASALPPQRPSSSMDCSSSTLLSMARASFFRAAEAPPHGAPTPCYIFSQPPLTLPRQPAQGPSSPWRPSPLLPAVTPRIFPAESLFPWAPPPCSFPLPAPRNCSSSSSPFSMADAQSSSSRSSNPAMACDSVSSLLACCCAVPMVLARCSTKCAATSSSSCAAGSLFGGANGQHAVMPPCVRCFCAAPNIDVVHPSDIATLLVWFHIGVIFIRLIVYVCCFIFVEERTPCFARRREAARRSSMFVAMHKSESPSSSQTSIGFVYGEPMHVTLDLLV